jgi:hypothetical protein
MSIGVAWAGVAVTTAQHSDLSWLGLLGCGLALLASAILMPSSGGGAQRI